MMSQYVIAVSVLICRHLLPMVASAQPFGSSCRRRQLALAMVTPSSISTPIPPPPPISMPVWTLAAPIIAPSATTTERETSMCIVTFASAVSVAPPKLWIMSLYANTMTRNSFCAAGGGVLQLLTSNHKLLVPILGKRSGYEPNFSKRDECAKHGFPWVKFGKSKSSSQDDQSAFSCVDLLPSCAAYIHVKMLSLTEAGDHEVALCEVVGTGYWDETVKEVLSFEEAAPIALDHEAALYTGELRRDGIL